LKLLTIEKILNLCYLESMAKKITKKLNIKQNPDINEIAFRIVQESTKEENKIKPNPGSK
jgi:hypothetical protein